ncbi:hypothetical protein SARC_06220 [Sphaeroforma arctica JP610]|uniref:Hexosyltransferase n=1 Tax=Sphaeroforma arctica JP610 TaxID=667725 RepID=A0A0L0FY13_9EUKA|nr:hypothetical protein SARC_06220 [Sphaeroforma arctica JP610]KNC81451.1 hypothetical protein SARC_06220 [Sphaeroforma arctica JP610]|eukprot:XP_014155353.1 hypothetical protein SARC_06220 [Sphaeroforma arctica JP610]
MTIIGAITRQSVKVVAWCATLLCVVLLYNLLHSSPHSRYGFIFSLDEYDKVLADLNLQSGVVLHGQTSISGLTVNYKFLDHAGYERKEGLIVGVLSDDSARRTNVRQTWGRNSYSKVLFLVENINGRWPQSEFYEFGDIVVVDRRQIVMTVPADGNQTERKTIMHVEAADKAIDTQAFFKLVYKHMIFSHVMITADSNYVALDSVKQMLDAANTAFWGYAVPHDNHSFNQEIMTRYPDERGYAIARDAVGCVTKKLATFEYLAEHEMAATKLLEACGHSLFHKDKLGPTQAYNGKKLADVRDVIVTGVQTWTDMSRIDREMSSS